jgi:hypothetical protein
MTNDLDHPQFKLKATAPEGETTALKSWATPKVIVSTVDEDTENGLGASADASAAS